MTYIPPRCVRCHRPDDGLDEAGLCWRCCSDADERAMAAAVACPARCPPLLARRGEPCSLLAGHDGPHTVPSGDIGVGSAWTNDEPRVDGWLDDPDEREHEDRSPISPERAVGPTLPDGPAAGRAALVSGLDPDCDDDYPGEEDDSAVWRCASCGCICGGHSCCHRPSVEQAPAPTPPSQEQGAAALPAGPVPPVGRSGGAALGEMLLDAYSEASALLRELAERDPCPDCGATDDERDYESPLLDGDHTPDCQIATWLRLYGGES